MIALMLTVELLSFQPQSKRANEIMRTMAKYAPESMQIRATNEYAGKGDLLVLWGPGSPDRFPAMAAQLAKGGHVVAMDLAYWQRDRKFRVSFDAAHPQAWVMKRDWPGSRFERDGVTVANVWKPNGPIIVAGIGRKARVQYGDDVDTWERAMIAGAKARWPERRILYRRKQQDAPVPSTIPLASNVPIEQLLTGASLVITWHSNVAVDAIRMGVPVICRDGAAAAVCPSVFGADDPTPLPVDVRDRFLRNLAWFQWDTAAEMKQFWAWVPEVLACA